MASGARKALNRSTSAAACDSSCTASKLAAQVLTTDAGYPPRAGQRAWSKVEAATAIAFEIASEGGFRLVNIGRRLLQRERQSVEFSGQLPGRVAFLGLGLLSPVTMEKECGRVLNG